MVENATVGVVYGFGFGKVETMYVSAVGLDVAGKFGHTSFDSGNSRLDSCGAISHDSQTMNGMHSLSSPDVSPSSVRCVLWSSLARSGASSR